jgi:hypothetical protein
MDNWNILLQLKTHQHQKLTRTIKGTTIITKGGWRTEYLKDIMDAMEIRVTSLKKASYY